MHMLCRHWTVRLVKWLHVMSVNRCSLIGFLFLCHDCKFTHSLKFSYASSSIEWFVIVYTTVVRMCLKHAWTIEKNLIIPWWNCTSCYVKYGYNDHTCLLNSCHAMMYCMCKPRIYINLLHMIPHVHAYPFSSNIKSIFLLNHVSVRVVLHASVIDYCWLSQPNVKYGS